MKTETAKWAKSTTKEENIAIKLSGRIKNFTGRSPAIIKVRINASIVTIHLKWFVSESEKRRIATENSNEIDHGKHKELMEFTRRNLLKVLPGVFGNRFEIYDFDGDSYQENLVVQIQLLDLVS